MERGMHHLLVRREGALRLIRCRCTTFRACRDSRVYLLRVVPRWACPCITLTFKRSPSVSTRWNRDAFTSAWHAPRSVVQSPRVRCPGVTQTMIVMMRSS
uniref:Uncharacterized protein n=1 Tax=Cacopsylla melanoneura TaxID=428564 RepID=A0A8D9F0X9_9HEMI